jgi:hypothetical protein
VDPVDFSIVAGEVAVFLIRNSAAPVNEKMEGVPMPRGTRDVRLLSRRALTEFASLRKPDRFGWGLLVWIGISPPQITDNHGRPLAGWTHYARQKGIRLTFGFDPGSFVGSKVL